MKPDTFTSTLVRVDSLEALERLVSMCEVHGDFSKGVTDPTGTVDEGDVVASEIIRAARAALASAAQPPITYAPPSPILGVAPSGPGTSAALPAAPKAAPAQSGAAYLNLPVDELRTNYLNLLQEVLDAKDVMLAAGCQHDSFGAMFTAYSASRGQAPAPAPASEIRLLSVQGAGRRIYVAGPMTGLPEFNFPAFNAAAAALAADGWHVENPAEHGIVDGAVWQDYMRYDLGRLATCAAIYLLPNWSRSKGALLEVGIAQALGMGVQLAPGAEAPAAVAGPSDEHQALDLLAQIFDAWENGTPCYEYPDGQDGFLGYAFRLDNDTFQACTELLNRRRPKNGDETAAPTTQAAQAPTSAAEFDDCTASPTGKHSESWFVNGDCSYCKSGAQPDAPLFYTSTLEVPPECEPHPPHRDCGCAECAPSFKAGEPTPAAQGDAPTDGGPISRKWLTVVYQDVDAGDEARALCLHPKASALSWSHAIRDRDIARAAKEGDKT